MINKLIQDTCSDHSTARIFKNRERNRTVPSAEKREHQKREHPSLSMRSSYVTYATTPKTGKRALEVKKRMKNGNTVGCAGNMVQALTGKIKEGREL